MQVYLCSVSMMQQTEGCKLLVNFAAEVYYMLLYSLLFWDLTCHYKSDKLYHVVVFVRQTLYVNLRIFDSHVTGCKEARNCMKWVNVLNHGCTCLATVKLVYTEWLLRLRLPGDGVE